MYWVNLGKKIIDLNYFNEKLTHLSILVVLDNINIIFNMQIQVVINSKKILKLPNYMELRQIQTWEMSLFTRRLPNFLQKSKQNFEELVKNNRKNKLFQLEDKPIVQLFLKELIEEIKLNPENVHSKTFLKLRPTDLCKI